MSIATLHLDDLVVIPGGKVLGSEHIVDLRSSSFLAADGWDIRETLPGVFSLNAEWLAAPVTVGGYGYSYTRASVEAVDTESPVALSQPKGKKR